MKYNQRNANETIGIIFKLLQDKRFTKLTITQSENIRNYTYDIETDEK